MVPELPPESQWQIKSGFVSKEIDKNNPKQEQKTAKGTHTKLK